MPGERTGSPQTQTLEHMNNTHEQQSNPEPEPQVVSGILTNNWFDNERLWRQGQACVIVGPRHGLLRQPRTREEREAVKEVEQAFDEAVPFGAEQPRAVSTKYSQPLPQTAPPAVGKPKRARLSAKAAAAVVTARAFADQGDSPS